MMNRPVLRYHGGKFLLKEWIISHFPLHRTYVEPFGGAGSVLMSKPRSFREIYNDLDESIVNLFEVLRDPELSLELYRQLSLTPYARAELEKAMSEGGVADPVQRARRTLILSFMGQGADSATRGYRTGFRTSRGTSRSPATDWINYVPEVRAFHERLQGVVIECRDAFHLIRREDAPTTLFYVDPPYHHSTRSQSGRHGYAYELDDDRHRELLELLIGLRGMVVLSGYRCELYDVLLESAGWDRIDREAYPDRGGVRVESLWVSPTAVENSSNQMRFEDHGT